MASRSKPNTKGFGTWLIENAGTLPEDYELDPSDMLDHPELIPSLADVATRKRLTPAALKAFVKLAKIWRLTDAEAIAISGIPTLRTWRRIKNGEWRGKFSQDQLTRLSTIFGIYNGLHILYSEHLADKWIRLANTNLIFRGRKPLDAMISGGIPILIEARRHIDASCNGR